MIDQVIFHAAHGRGFRRGASQPHAQMDHRLTPENRICGSVEDVRAAFDYDGKFAKFDDAASRYRHPQKRPQ
jgi:hypothetical protein